MKKCNLIQYLILFTLILSQITQPETSNALSWEWAKTIGSADGNVNGYSITTDNDRNYIVTGNFKSTVDFGGTILTPISIDPFIAKYSESGLLQWVKTIYKESGYYNPSIRSLTTDSENNIIVCGSISGNVRFDDATIINCTDTDMFIAKYSSAGTFLWVKTASGNYTSGYNNDNASDVAVDSFDNIYVTGTMKYGDAIFDDIQLDSGGTFIAKYGKNSDLIWAKHLCSAKVAALTADSNGNILVLGHFPSTRTFENETLTSKGEDDIYLVKYNTNGDIQWIVQAGGDRDDEAADITMDDSGNIYITGYFESSANFGPFTLNGKGIWDFFVAKYDSSGICQWAKQGGGYNEDGGEAIKIDIENNIIVTGFFRGSEAFFEHITLVDDSDEINAFVAKYDNNGNLLSAIQAKKESDPIYPYDLSIDNSNNAYIVGTFNGTAVFGDSKISSLYSYDAFIAKVNLEIAHFDISGKISSSKLDELPIINICIDGAIPNCTTTHLFKSVTPLNC